MVSDAHVWDERQQRNTMLLPCDTLAPHERDDGAVGAERGVVRLVQRRRLRMLLLPAVDGLRRDVWSRRVHLQLP